MIIDFNMSLLWKKKEGIIVFCYQFVIRYKLGGYDIFVFQQGIGKVLCVNNKKKMEELYS